MKSLLAIFVLVLSGLFACSASEKPSTKELWRAAITEDFFDTKAEAWNADWTSGDLDAQRVVSLANEKSLSNRVIEIRYQKKQTSKGGIQVAANLGETDARGRSDLYLGYYLKLHEDFDFKLGGKLPGFATQNTGGGKRPVRGFSTRNMWREGGELVLYLYVPKQLNYGAAVDHPWGIDVPYHSKLIPGKWHYLVQRVRLNTPGQADGLFEGWIDGEKKVLLDNIMYRLGDQTYSIQHFWFSTFFGGNGPEWEPESHQFAQFSEFVVADGYPVLAPPDSRDSGKMRR